MRYWYQEMSQATVSTTSLFVPESGTIEARGDPRLFAIPAIVRRKALSLKRSAASTIATSGPESLRRIGSSTTRSTCGLRDSNSDPSPGRRLRRLSAREQQTVEAADIFNASDYRRTVGGIAKSLGEPRASIVPLSGVSGELIVTVAWDISWYQYRVTPDSAQPVRLAERGHELADLDATYQRWNAQIEGDGRLVPRISPV